MIVNVHRDGLGCALVLPRPWRVARDGGLCERSDFERSPSRPPGRVNAQILNVHMGFARLGERSESERPHRTHVNVQNLNVHTSLAFVP